MIDQVIDLLVDEKILIVSSTVYKLLYWLAPLLLGFMYVGSIIWATYINYLTRKRDNIKYDENDIPIQQEESISKLSEPQ
jgi:hypothetical protein